MLEAAEPLPLVMWAILAMSLGMYPLGLLLPGCLCCGDNCDDLFEFTRCIRFESPNIGVLGTSYETGNSVDMPVHGYSRRVSRPEDIGCRRVPIKMDVTGNAIRVGVSATEMSAGQSQQATYTISYSLDNFGTTLSPARSFAVTVQGVDVPLTDTPAVARPPTTFYQRESTGRLPVEFTTLPFWLGSIYHSIAAPVSATVFDAVILSGGQHFDSSFTTRASLMSCASAALSVESRNWGLTHRCELSGTIPAEHFRYMPVGATATIRFVVRAARGSASRFSTYDLIIENYIPPDTVQSGVSLGANWQANSYSDSPMPSIVPVFGELSNATLPVTVFSHTTLVDEGGVVPLPDFELTPTGDELLAGGSLAVVVNQPSSYVSPLFPSRYGFHTSVVFKKSAYIMRFKDSWKQMQSATWNLNTAEVGHFLAGDIPLTVQLVGETDPWVVGVSDATAFCGYSLCSDWVQDLFVPGVVTPLYHDIIPHTVTFTAASGLPQQWTSTDSSGVSAVRTNECFGQDRIIERNMRLAPTFTDLSCVYRTNFRTCESLNASYQGGGGEPRGFSMRASLRWFFCGDLLWAIENGPCRSSIFVAQVDGWPGGTFDLGGDDEAMWDGDYWCPAADGGVTAAATNSDGKCAPLSLELTLSRESYVAFGLTAGGSYSSIGTIPAGTYAMPLQLATCNSQVYAMSIAGIGVIGLSRSRTKWCDSWGEWRLAWNGTNWFVRNDDGTGYKLHGFLQPGIDFEPPQYEEIDPVQTAVVPSEVSITAGAQTVTVQRCCPPRSESVFIPANDRRQQRRILVESSQSLSRGATLTITQAAGGPWTCAVTELSLVWVNGDPVHPYSRLMPGDGCPLLAQMTFTEQPSCDFTASSGSEWLTVRIRDDKLIEMTADSASIDQYSEWLNDSRVRSSVLTITSGTNSLSVWKVFQRAR